MKKRAIALLAAAFMLLGGCAAAADEGGSVAVDPETGAVEKDESYDGPQITKIRVLKEGTFLEIYWDRYVDEAEAVNVENFVLKNGDKVIELEPKGTEGYTNTLYFDNASKENAASEYPEVMGHLSDDFHMSSICYTGELGEVGKDGLTLEVKGEAIKDGDGKSAKTATYTGVPQTEFYTQFLTSETGIIIKADDTVAKSTMEAAAALVDIELGKTETGIAAQLVKNGASLAIYSSRENVYLIPEQRYNFTLTSYDVEGLGGSMHDNCVSSIAERNVLRIKGNKDDPEANTRYPDENILIHEFGHAVKLVGMDTMEDQTLADEFYAAYENAKENGLWYNTYRISNPDEFFATMCTVWFNVMDEVDNWEDGVRCPLNTREELKKYDPQTYAFFEKILPDETLPAPWDEAAPDVYHDEYIGPGADEMGTEAVDSDFDKDCFMLEIISRGETKEVDRYAPNEEKPDENLCTWWKWGTDDATEENWAWKVVKTDSGAYRFISYDGSAAMTALSKTTVSADGHAPDEADEAQQWKFVGDPDTKYLYDGKLVNVKYGTELTYTRPLSDGSILCLTEKGDNWMVRNTTQSKAVGDLAYLNPAASDEPAGTTDDTDTPDDTAAPDEDASPALKWAEGKGITLDTGKTCTRAQAVACLWQAEGSPKADGQNPFADVDADASYADAVAWAVSQGITNGTSKTTFSPDAALTNGQAMVYLWRAFTDGEAETSGAYYDAAVAWAKEQGMIEDAFDPAAPCTGELFLNSLYLIANK